MPALPSATAFTREGCKLACAREFREELDDKVGEGLIKR